MPFFVSFIKQPGKRLNNEYKTCFEWYWKVLNWKKIKCYTIFRQKFWAERQKNYRGKKKKKIWGRQATNRETLIPRGRNWGTNTHKSTNTKITKHFKKQQKERKGICYKKGSFPVLWLDFCLLWTYILHLPNFKKIFSSKLTHTCILLINLKHCIEL